MKLAFFGYAWNKEMQPDAYMAETIDAFVRAGAHVDFYLGSQITKEYGIYGLKPGIAFSALHNFIEGEAYDAAFAFNHSMLIPEVLSAIKGRVATILVDEPEHFFDPRGEGPWAVMREDVEVVAMSSAVERRIKEAVPGIGPRLHFMLPATHLDRSERPKTSYPISWVASYVGDLNLDQYLKLMVDRPEYYALTTRCLDVVARDGDLRVLKAINGQEMALIRGLPWTFEYFQTQIQNILTNRSRVEVVERLAPHGLALFGNPGWQKLLTYNAAVMQALQPGPPPSKHADLRAIYNGSKISINVPQTHVASGSVQYRVIDVMGSNALMITRRNAESDLYRVFGADCPVPTYTNLEELESLCVHYLGAETERQKLVAQCNALLADGFDFQQRAAKLLEIVGLEPPATGRVGSQRRVDLSLFMDA